MKLQFASSLLAAATLALGACASDGKQAGGGGGETANYDSQLKAVQAAYAQLDQNGGAWVFTSEMIENAKKAASEGKSEEALKLLAKAKFEVDAAGKQQDEQKKAGPVLF